MSIPKAIVSEEKCIKKYPTKGNEALMWIWETTIENDERRRSKKKYEGRKAIGDFHSRWDFPVGFPK